MPTAAGVSLVVRPFLCVGLVHRVIRVGGRDGLVSTDPSLPVADSVPQGRVSQAQNPDPMGTRDGLGKLCVRDYLRRRPLRKQVLACLTMHT